MKKVKTLLSVFFCIMATALFGACACTAPNISASAIQLDGVSDNLIYEDGANQYLVRQGEKFSITYSILPSNASDLTTYIEISNNHYVSTEKSIISSNKATNTVEFVAHNTNSGRTNIKIETKEKGHQINLVVEVLSDADIAEYPIPSNIKYNSSTNKFTWDKSTVLTSKGLKEAEGYVISVNDVEYTTKTNSLDMRLESGVDYFVRAKAVGNLAERTGDSELGSEVRFYVANTPLNLKANDGILTWEYSDEANINKFAVEFGGKTVYLEKNVREFNLAQYIVDANIEGLSQFNIKLSAINSEFVDGAVDENGIVNHIITSRNNPSLTLTQLTAPSGLDFYNELQPGDVYISSMLKWNPIPNAKYLISIKKSNQEVAQFTTASTSINLSEIESVQDKALSQTSGEYTLTITPQGDAKNTFARTDAVSSINFVVTPFLYGTMDYATNSLSLDVSILKNILEVDNLEEISYELYYSSNPVSGYYENVKKNIAATNSLDLSSHLTMAEPYYVLVRPVVKDSYTSKNVVLPVVDIIRNNRSVNSSISQLNSVDVNSIDVNGVITGIDNNENGVNGYKIIVNGVVSTIESNLLIKNEYGVFTMSVNDMLTDGVNDYNIQIIPTSTSKIDANPSDCSGLAFVKLGNVDMDTLRVNNNVISWTAVPKADKYSITINDDNTYEVMSNSYEVTDTTILSDSNKVTIKAVGNGENQISGQSVSTAEGSPILRASQVEGFKIEEGLLKWTDIADSNYIVAITYSADNVELMNLGTTASFDGLLKVSTTATITVVRNLENMFSSIESQSIVLTKLDTVNNDLVLKDHTTTAEFTAVGGADYYNVLMYNSGGEKVQEIQLIVGTNASISDDKITFTLPSLDAGKYTLTIQALVDDQLTGTSFNIPGSVSAVNNIEYYPSVVEENKTRTLSWLFTGDNVENYVIKFNGKYNPSSGNYEGSYDDITTVNTTYDFAELTAGKYSITISVISGEINVVYAAPTTITIDKTETPSISYSNGAIEFTTISTASDYLVYNANTDELIDDSDYELITLGQTISIQPKSLVVGNTYSMYIVAVGAENYLDGNKSNVVNFQLTNVVNNFALLNNVFSWDNVINNNGYIVELIDKTSGDVLETKTCPVNTNTYEIPEKYRAGGAYEFEAGRYEISVVTIGKLIDDVNYINSNPSSIEFAKLDQISDMQFRNDVISWTYAGAGTPSGYLVEFYPSPSWEKAEGKSLTIPHNAGRITLDLNLIDLNEYKIVITVIGDEVAFTLTGNATDFKYTINLDDGGTSDIDVFKRIETSSFNYSNGVVSINEVAGAESYEIYHRTGEEGSFDYTKLDGIITDLVITPPYSNYTYTLVIKTIASEQSGKLNSLYSEPIVIEQFLSINDFAINSDGIITWTPIFIANDDGDGDITEEEKTYLATAYIIRVVPVAGEGELTYTLNSSSANSVDFQTLYDELGLQEGVNYQLSIRALAGKVGDVYYLNNTPSRTIFIDTVGKVENITMSDGVITWTPLVNGIKQVNTYIVEVVDKFDVKKTYTVNEASFNANNLTFRENEILKATIRPYSTNNSTYVVVYDPENTLTEISFSRYNCIKSISVEKGLIKLGIDIYGISDNDLSSIISASDYNSLDSIIKERYFGYYTFNFNINGVDKVVTLNDMTFDKSPQNIAQVLLTKVLYATYELKDVVVTTTTLLTIDISSKGNKGNSSFQYNYITSTPKQLKAYKHSAPIPTASPNLVSSKGEISFKKVAGVNKYVLIAYNAKDYMECIIDTSSDQLGSATYNLGNVSQLTFTGTNNKIKGGENYTYTLTTLGTESGHTGDLYLRSNSYSIAIIKFLADPGLKYIYSDKNLLGGYLTWGDSETNVGYRLYALPYNLGNGITADNRYSGSMKINKSWFNDPACYVAEFSRDTFEYSFEDGGFVLNSDLSDVGNDFSKITNLIELPVDPNDDANTRGKYWVAIQALGDGYNTITHQTEGSVYDVVKVADSDNAELKDGTFSWTNIDNGRFSGFRISVNVYDDENYQLIDTITSEHLVKQIINSKYNYVLEDYINRLNEDTGLDEATYSISIVALGGNINGTYYVNSSCTNIETGAVDGDGNPIIDGDTGKQIMIGFPRLNKINLTVNEDITQMEWVKQNSYISKYQLFINNTLSNAEIGITQSLSFNSEVFAQIGDYLISLQALASGNSYLNSLVSEHLAITKFAPPVVSTKDGVLVWNNDLNGPADNPPISEITIYNSDSAGTTGSLVSTKVYDHVDGSADNYNSNYSLTLDELRGGLFFRIQAKFLSSSAVLDNGVTVYYIASASDQLLHTYKLVTPNADTVKNFSEDGATAEWEGVGSCIKWPLVEDRTGNLLTSYLVNIEVQIGVDAENNPVYGQYNGIVEMQEGYSTIAPFKIENIAGNPSTKAYCVQEIDDVLYGYFNTTFLSFDGSVNGFVRITITAIDNNKSQINSSIKTLELNYNNDAPECELNNNGIITWNDYADTPMYITLEYYEREFDANGRPLLDANDSIIYKTDPNDKKVVNYYLSTSYYATYGKTFYLPFMANYEKISFQYVIDESRLSNEWTVSVFDPKLFTNGSGTDSDPYIITESSEFNNIQYRPFAHFKVMTSTSTLNNWQMLDNFYGVLDGNNSQLNVLLSSVEKDIDDHSEYFAGLFYTLHSTAVIKNFNIVFASTVGLSHSPIAKTLSIGGIAINNYGIIDNINISGSITAFGLQTCYYATVSINNRLTVNDDNDIINIGTISNIEINNFTANINIKPATSATTDHGVYASGIAYRNNGIIYNVNNNGIIDLDAINPSASNDANKYLNTTRIRYASGITYENSGVIINGDFTGQLKAYSMAGISNVNKYSNTIITVNIDGKTAEYSRGTILGCYSNGKFALPTVRESVKSIQHIYVAGIVGNNNGGYIGRSYAILEDNLQFNNQLSTSSALDIFVGGIVAYNQTTSSHYPIIDSCVAVVNATYTKSTNNNMYCGSIVGYSSISNNDFKNNGYGISNTYYVSNYSPISNVASISTVVKLSNIADISGHIETLNTGDDSIYGIVRQWAYDGELKLITYISNT